mmetsp:Transcript_100713/g.280580  ORF Transcript_100713/g.280580 Transcript_100713/m.280580 type:complete len:204 (-) Transcript_100713:219-830(-)
MRSRGRRTRGSPGWTARTAATASATSRSRCSRAGTSSWSPTSSRTSCRPAWSIGRSGAGARSTTGSCANTSRAGWTSGGPTTSWPGTTTTTVAGGRSTSGTCTSTFKVRVGGRRGSACTPPATASPPRRRPGPGPPRIARRAASEAPRGADAPAALPKTVVVAGGSIRGGDGSPLTLPTLRCHVQMARRNADGVYVQSVAYQA